MLFVLLTEGPLEGELHSIDDHPESGYIKVEFADLEQAAKVTKLDYAWYRRTDTVLPLGVTVYRYDPRAL